jgi:hypothetical protein
VKVRSPRGCEQRNPIADREAAARGEDTRQDDRVRLAQENQRVVHLGDVGARLVDANGGIVGHVDALHGHERPAVVGREGDAADDRRRQLDPVDGRDGVRHRLRKRAALGAHLQGGAAGDGVDRVGQAPHDLLVGEVDGTHERHATRERHQREPQAGERRAQEACRHAQLDQRPARSHRTRTVASPT